MPCLCKEDTASIEQIVDQYGAPTPRVESCFQQRGSARTARVRGDDLTATRGARVQIIERRPSTRPTAS
jgi:hypothetical protein